MSAGATVWVFVWEHTHGTEAEVFMSEESAQAWRQSAASASWAEEIGPSVERPTDRAVLADLYFKIVGEREIEPQYCAIYPRRIQE